MHKNVIALIVIIALLIVIVISSVVSTLQFKRKHDIKKMKLLEQAKKEIQRDSKKFDYKKHNLEIDKKIYKINDQVDLSPNQKNRLIQELEDLKKGE